MPGKYNITIKQGDTYQSKTIQWKRGDVPVDLTNLTGKCQVRTAPNSGIIATVNVNVADAVSGLFDLSLTAEQTAAIPTDGKTPDVATAYVYDLEFAGVGYVETILQGEFNVTPGVSK